jgi:hypothetical protein
MQLIPESVFEFPFLASHLYSSSKLHVQIPMSVQASVQCIEGDFRRDVRRLQCDYKLESNSLINYRAFAEMFTVTWF